MKSTSLELVLVLTIVLFLVACSSAPPAAQSNNQSEILTISAEQVTSRPGTAVVTIYPNSVVPGRVDIATTGTDMVTSYHDYSNGGAWKHSLSLWYGGTGIFGSPYFKIVIFSPTPGAVASFKVTFQGKKQTFSVKTP